MEIYLINNVLILVWAAIFCSNKPGKVRKLIFIILAFAQLLTLAILRTHIGNDYDMYSGGFYQMKMKGFEQMSYKDWEIGFVFLTKLLALVVPNHLIYMGILTAVCIVPVAVYIYLNSKIPWLSTLMFVNMFIFFMEMNFVRQAIALVFVMWAWHFMKKAKFIPFAVLILIASLFHQTVLIMLVVYFWVKMTPGLKALIAYGYVLVCFYISSEGIFNILTKFFHEEYSNSEFVTTGVSFVYAIFPVFVALAAFILYQTGTISPTKENKYLVNFGLLNALIMITMSRHAILERFSYYTLIFVILLVPVIVSSLRENGIKTRRLTSGGKSRGVDWTSTGNKRVLSWSMGIAMIAISSGIFIYGMLHNAHGAAPYNSLWSALNLS